MNTPTQQIAHQVSDLDNIFQLQRDAFRRQSNPPAGERRAHLDVICRQLLENDDAIAAAIDADFGHRSVHETKILEIFPALQAAKHAQVVALADGGSQSMRKLSPTIVTTVNNDMRVMQDEIFGPLPPIVPHHNLDEALGYVADHPRALAKAQELMQQGRNLACPVAESSEDGPLLWFVRQNERSCR